MTNIVADRNFRRYLTEKEVAALGIMGVSSLQKMRSRGGPDSLPYLKFGGSIRYDIFVVEEWIGKRERLSTSQYSKRNRGA